MFLSKLVLNPRSRQVRRELAEPYEMHRTLLRAFPDANAGGPGRVLFRVDVGRATGIPTLLMQSEKPPDWSSLEALRDYLSGAPAESRPVCLQFATGQQLRFRLRANPTVKRNGKRLGLLREEDQIAWLRRKGEEGGFALNGVVVIPDGFTQGRKTDDHGPHELSHFAVRFDGVLTVTDSDRFAQTLAAGVGSGKAFGFGLLSVPYPEAAHAQAS
jgi:CRISPR system Cascade subunit CasE